MPCAATSRASRWPKSCWASPSSEYEPCRRASTTYLVALPEDILENIMRAPPASIPYVASRAIAAARPDKAVIETEHPLQLALPLREGAITVRSSPASHSRVVTNWLDFDAPLSRSWRTGWRLIRWGDHDLEVVRLEWSTQGCPTMRSWIIADDRETGEAFLRYVTELNERLHGEVWVYDQGHWQKSRELFQAIQRTSFDDLILEPLLDGAIKTDFQSFLSAKDAYAKHGIAWKRGALFVGAPGNGKTHTVKALVRELGIPCLYVKTFVSRFANPQMAIHQVFQLARDRAPCALVLEDLDSLLAEDTRAFFLNELDGFHDNEGLITIASTNHPERLDAAILERPSRFDRKYHFKLPATAERQRYVDYWNAKLEVEMRLDDAQRASVVEKTDGFSFAYLKELYASALMAWIHDPRDLGAHVAAQIEPLRAQMKA